MLVVAFHLDPDLVPGGYVGVDAFFVISGFLITSHIATQVERTGTLKLREFWARRLRRLLPAAVVVLVSSTIATWLFVPSTLWEQTVRQVIASALYVQNWALAADAVDYLAEGNSPTVAQHYWSLSVEEQFYVIWPLLTIATVVVLRRMGRLHLSRSALGVVIAGLSAASLAYSIHLTSVDPSRAYFVTGTRVWEFGLGSVLALMAVGGWKHASLRVVSGWVGVALLTWAGLRFDSQTPFPGWAALLPVVGTMAIISAGGPQVRGSAAQLLSLRPVRFIGDISYSVYLWHWPIVVVVPFITGHALTRVDMLLALAATVVLAWATTRLVEDPLRQARWLSKHTLRTFVLAGTSMAVVSAGALAVQWDLDRQIDQTSAGTTATECLGPAAIGLPTQCPPAASLADLVAGPAAVSRQNASPPFRGCQTNLRATEVATCLIGSTSPTRTIAIVGDSHATQWFAALDRVGKDRGWAVRTYVRASCPWTPTERVLPDEPPETWPLCRSHNAEVLQLLLDDPAIDLVLTSSFSHAYDWREGEARTGQAALEAGVSTYDRMLHKAGKPLVVIRDVPAVKDLKNSPDCLAAADSLTDCDLSRSEALTPDLYASAAQRLGIPVIDLTDAFCDDTACRAVVGSTIVYRDYSHLSQEYSDAMAPLLGRAIDAAAAQLAQ
jgi:peptidoglycan/LPS O-acetylase OafA/YrhL